MTEAGIKRLQQAMPKCVITPVDWERFGVDFDFNIDAGPPKKSTPSSTSAGSRKMGTGSVVQAGVARRNVAATVPVPFFRRGWLRRKRGQAPSPEAVLSAQCVHEATEPVPIFDCRCCTRTSSPAPWPSPASAIGRRRAAAVPRKRIAAIAPLPKRRPPSPCPSSAAAYWPTSGA